MEGIKKQLTKRLWALALAFVMVISYVPADALAADYLTTEASDEVENEKINAQVYIISKATRKLVTVDGVDRNPVNCNTVYDSDNIPINGIFTIDYKTTDMKIFEGSEVVNFWCNVNNPDDPKKGSLFVANSTSVVQTLNHAYPHGHESLLLVHNDDGTVSFRNNDTGGYVTLVDNKLACIDLKKGEKPSANEKFIVFTKTKPKSPKKVTLSDMTGGSIKVSWASEKETLFSSYQVLYSTSENGNYQVAGTTGDNEFEIEGLNNNSTYYVKVRAIVNNETEVYSDSKVAYAKTTAEYKPAKPDNLRVKEEAGQVTLEWDVANHANAYKVYRAESRYGDYTQIAAGITGTKWVDTDPNKSSKYNNYYKVSAYNSELEGEKSKESSLEITMFGNNTYIFSSNDNQEDIDRIESDAFDKQHYNQFGTERYAFLYKPGDYTSTKHVIETGYYTQILGLGKTPTEVNLYNVKTPPALSNNNVTCNFWQGIENVTIKDVENNGDDFFDFQWAVSQAAPARRLNVERKAWFDWWYGWASGGFFADTYFAKPAGSGSQQQYYYRNCKMNQGTYGVVWNQVLQGCEGINAGNADTYAGMNGAKDLKYIEGRSNWQNGGCTTVVDKTPVIREKSFLYFDTNSDSYKVFVPALRKNATGITWSASNMGAGTSIDVNKYFYIAKPEKDTADSINAQLSAGKNILFTPGIYHVNKPIKVNKANTILLGIGLATIIPDNEESAIKIADVGGVSVDGLVLDAGTHSKTMLEVGEEGCNKNHKDNPTVLHDVIYRVGGTGSLGSCDSCQVINSNDVIVDQTWIWRADHGENVAWHLNKSKNGIVVNGDDVYVYGLFCEHFQEYDVLWRGENGKVFFLQNEKCYDPQNQADWMSHDGQVKGYASYKVTNNVKNHYAVGLGVYDVFIYTNGASIFCDNAMEVPDNDGVKIENACIVEIADGNGPMVGINNIINHAGPGITTGRDTKGGFAVQKMYSYSNGVAACMGDVYTSGENNTVLNTEQGVSPTVDNKADKTIVKEAASKDDEKPLWEMKDSDYNEKIENGDVIPETTTVAQTTEQTTSSQTTTARSTTVASTTTKSATTAVEQTTITTTTEATSTVTPQTSAEVIANKVTNKPASTKVKKVIKKKSAKLIKIKLKKVKAVAGYQIKVFKTKKTKKALYTKCFKKASFKIKSKKLKRNKLWVAARTYIVNGDSKIWSDWSKRKNVKLT